MKRFILIGLALGALVSLALAADIYLQITPAKTYATEAAMRGAAVVPADRGKTAYRSDDGSLWVLDNDDPIRWRQIANPLTAAQIDELMVGATIVGNATSIASGVTGPASSTDNALARFNGTGGITLQNGVILQDDIGGLSSSLTVGANPALTSNTVTVGTTGLIFEGATMNAYEGLLTLTDPTADRTWTLPNWSGQLSTRVDVSGTPTIAKGSAAGTTPTLSLAGTNRTGLITLTTGTDLSTGTAQVVCTVTFNPAITGAVSGAIVVIGPGNVNAAALSGNKKVYPVMGPSSTSFALAVAGSASDTLDTSTQYVWAYHVDAY